MAILNSSIINGNLAVNGNISSNVVLLKINSNSNALIKSKQNILSIYSPYLNIGYDDYLGDFTTITNIRANDTIDITSSINVNTAAQYIYSGSEYQRNWAHYFYASGQYGTYIGFTQDDTDSYSVSQNVYVGSGTYSNTDNSVSNGGTMYLGFNGSTFTRNMFIGTYSGNDKTDRIMIGYNYLGYGTYQTYVGSRSEGTTYIGYNSNHVSSNVYVGGSSVTQIGYNGVGYCSTVSVGAYVYGTPSYTFIGQVNGKSSSYVYIGGATTTYLGFNNAVLSPIVYMGGSGTTYVGYNNSTTSTSTFIDGTTTYLGYSSSSATTYHTVKFKGKEMGTACNYDCTWDSTNYILTFTPKS